MIVWCLVHLWCWMWGLGVHECLAAFCTFLSVIESIVELVFLGFFAMDLYENGLRIGRENGKWYVKWDEKARKSRW